MNCFKKFFALLFVGTLCNSMSYAGNSLSAGTGRAEVTIPDSYYPLESFTGQHDPIMVRVVLMNAGAQRIAIMTIDQTSLFAPTITSLKKILYEQAGVLPENSMIVATHGFSTPHVLVRPQYTQAEKERVQILEDQIEKAARHAIADATTSAQQVQLKTACGVSMVNINRDIQTKDGMWVGHNTDGFVDHSDCVIKMDSMQGKTLAVLMNYGVQSAVTAQSITDGKSGKLISADLAGAATRYIENYYGDGVIAVYFPGDTGDQVPIFTANYTVENKVGELVTSDIHEKGFLLVDLLGTRLGEDTVKVSNSAHASDSTTLQMYRKSVMVPGQTYPAEGIPTKPAKQYTYINSPDPVEVPLVFIQIGDTAVVGTQVELAAVIGAQIKKNSPFAQTMIVNLADGAAKYMADQDSYDHYAYEARNSRYGRGAAEKMAEFIGQQLVEMKEGK